MNIFTNCEWTDERTNSISDFSANPRVVQFHYSLITFRILPAFRDSVAGMNVSFICVTRLSQLPDHAKVSDPAENYILSLHQHFLIHPTACVCRLRIKEIFAKLALAASVTNTLFWCYQGLAEPSSAMVHCTTPWSKPSSDTFDVDDGGAARLAWVPVWSFFLLFLLFCFLVKNVNINRNH